MISQLEQFHIHKKEIVMVKKIILMTSVLIFMLCCCKQGKEIDMKVIKSTDKITSYQPEGTDTIITLSYDENNELLSLTIGDDKSDFHFATNLLPQGDIQAIVVKDRKGLNLIYNDFGPSGSSYQIVNKNYENKTNVNLDQMNSIERYESINKISKTYIIDKDGKIIE